MVGKLFGVSTPEGGLSVMDKQPSMKIDTLLNGSVFLIKGIVMRVHPSHRVIASIALLQKTVCEHL